jgi:CheY-like chemotaxis protein
MDLRMPEMDGIEATRRIRQEWSQEQRPRIVVLSASLMPDERQACLDAGVDELLLKPALRAPLQQVLERCQAPAAAQLNR